MVRLSHCMKGTRQFNKGTGRPGMVLALLSFGLLMGGLDAVPAGVRAADLSPAELYGALDRGARETYAYAARLVSDLRLFYEINSRLEELRAEAAAPAAKASGEDAEASEHATDRCPFSVSSSAP